MSWNWSLFERWPNLSASVFSPLFTQTHSSPDLDTETPPKLVLVSIINALHVAKSKCQSPSKSTCQLSQLIAPPHGSDFFTCPLRHCTLHFPSAPLAVPSQTPLLDPLLLDNLPALKCPKAQPMNINLFSSLYTHPLADSLQFHGF